jgi:hypothetical protein
MSTKCKHSLISSFGEDKYKENKTIRKAQLVKVYNALKERPMTMKEVDVVTGVMRESVCRHISTLREQNRVAVIRKRKCSITGYLKVLEFTTDPSLFPEPNQIKLF